MKYGRTFSRLHEEYFPTDPQIHPQASDTQTAKSVGCDSTRAAKDQYNENEVLLSVWTMNMLSYLNPLPSLPEYTGPHKVGSAEYEIPLRALGLEPVKGPHSISTIRFRLFYPATVEDNAAKGVPWLPEPQTTYLEGYLKMARLNPWLSSILLSVPLFLRSTMMPAYKNAPLLRLDTPLPVCIFSHGLVGNMNTHSAILGELASHGVFCVALEHRDGSGALSLVRNGDAEAVGEAPSEVLSVPWKRISLKIRPGVLEERDEQIRIRIFEIMALYQALELLDEGQALKNLAHSSDEEFSIPRGSLSLKPESVIWAGHSFGGATIIQLVKSIYYDGQRGGVAGAKSLLLQQPQPSLVKQITPISPVVILDPWFMPLKSQGMDWLFRKPLPCHDAKSKMAISQGVAKTVVVMSSEFASHWPECHAHMEAITSPVPGSVKVQTQEEYEMEMKKYKSPRDFMDQSKKIKGVSPSPSVSGSSTPQQRVEKEVEGAVAASPVSSFVLHHTTHVTHSDFGLLFQWFTWYFTGQKNPELAVQNIAKCILGAAGLSTSGLAEGTGQTQLEQLP